MRPAGRRPLAAALTGLAVLAGSLAPGGAQPPGAPVPPTPAAPAAPAPPAPPGPRPGTAAPGEVVRELQVALAQGIRRFEAKDLAGVLAGVSEQYWTGPLTKATLRAQLLGVFQVYQQVRARIRLDEVRLVDGHAWVYSTGEIAGQLPVVGQWMSLFWWERELEVARREGGQWRLYGYQQ